MAAEIPQGDAGRVPPRVARNAVERRRRTENCDRGVILTRRHSGAREARTRNLANQLRDSESAPGGASRNDEKRTQGLRVSMGKVTGFLEIERHDRKYTPVGERVKHYNEFVVPLSEKETRDQAARCMNCGIPYCHGTGSVAPGTPGCPVNNQIPDFNDLVYQAN